MIRFLVMLRLRTAWRKLEKTEVLILNAFLLLSSLLYAWVLAEGIKILLQTDDTDIAPETILRYLLYGMVVLGLVRMILPSYSPLKPLVPAYFPLDAFRRTLLSLLDGFLQAYFLYLSIFLIAASLLSPFIEALFLANALLTIMGTELLRRLLQYLIDFRQKPRTILLSISVAVLITAVWMHFSGHLSALIWVNLMGVLLLGWTSVLLEQQAVEKHPRRSRNAPVPLAPFIKQTFLHPRARQPLMVALLVKILFLAIDYGHFQWKGEHLLGEELSLWFLASPLALFSYLFNNSWGYWREVWLRMRLSRSGFLPFALFQWRMMALPLLIDGSLSLSVLALYWDNITGIIVYYLTISFFYAGSAPFWSLRSPLRIHKSFQRKPTSSLSSFLTMFAAMMLTIMFWSNAFRALIPLYLLAGLAAFLVARSIFPEWKYHIHQLVFKGKR
jgi:hypothetical protein